MINFVSNLPSDLRSGGFSAMNVAAYQALRAVHEVSYAGPINPVPARRHKFASKALRLAHLPGDYAFYSQQRLRTIASQVAAQCDPIAELDFFHGFTPWTMCQSDRPYASWSDCSFRDYVSHYHQRTAFRAADLDRIERDEAAWLRGARAIGFTSAWAAKRATRDYALDPARVHVLGIFGEIEPPEFDSYAGSPQFAFVSTDFAAKGGHEVLAAFRTVFAHHGEASLVIVGDAPAGLNPEAGVTVLGYLHKEDPAQNQRLREVLAASRAVVHPTRSDIAPLLLVEAGYFGCPAISARRFAIGEIVVDGKTGVLLDDPGDVGAIAAAMTAMLNVPSAQYLAMRQAAWTRTRGAFSKAGFAGRLRAMLNSARRVAP